MVSALHSPDYESIITSIIIAYFIKLNIHAIYIIIIIFIYKLFNFIIYMILYSFLG